MTVLDRLFGLAPRDPVAIWRPTLELRYVAPMLERIETAGAMLTLGHGYKRMSRQIAAALKAVVPEIEWLRRA